MSGRRFDRVPHPLIILSMTRRRVVYNKLVRDLIPSRLAKLHIPFKARVADAHELPALTIAKVREELNELEQAQSPVEVLAEMADLAEAVNALAVCHGITPAQLDAARTRKNEARGAFVAGLVLVWSEADEAD